MTRTWLRWGLLAFAAFYLLHSPDGAAHAVVAAGHGAGRIGAALSAFLNRL